MWDGSPIDRLLVDVSDGGLGDTLRALSVLAAVRRLGRAREVLVVCRPGVARAFLTRALWPVPVRTLDEPLTGDAALIPIHGMPPRAWDVWPHRPLTAVVAHLLGLPLAALAGPCLNLEVDEVDGLRQTLPFAGWEPHQPLIAVQTNGHAVGTPLNQAHHHERVPRVLDALVPVLRDRGMFVMRVGGPLAPRPTPGVLDLGGSSIARMLAALALADLAVTGDSGPLHAAGALGTPVLALFGPSDPRLNACAAGVTVLSPPASACSHLPCGVGSFLGGPTLGDHVTRVPLPCPPEGGCLSRMSTATIAEATEATLDRIRSASRLG